MRPWWQPQCESCGWKTAEGFRLPVTQTGWRKTDENALKADHGCRWKRDQTRALADVNMPRWPKLDREAWPRPRYIKHPWRNGSVLELLMRTCRLEGLTSASTCKSWMVKWMDGSKVQLTVNSPALGNRQPTAWCALSCGHPRNAG